MYDTDNEDLFDIHSLSENSENSSGTGLLNTFGNTSNIKTIKIPGKDDEDLKKLRDYDEFTRIKALLPEEVEKKKAQDEIDKKVKDGKRTWKEERTEKKLQKSIINQKRKLDNTEKDIEAKKNKYLHKLTSHGVKENDAGNYLDGPIPAKAKKNKFKRKLVDLYATYDKQLANYNQLNKDSKEEKEKFLDADDLKKVSMHHLSLPGVSASKEVSKETPEQRADHTLWFAEIEARTSDDGYKKVTESWKNAEDKLKKVTRQKEFETKSSVLNNEMQNSSEEDKEKIALKLQQLIEEYNDIFTQEVMDPFATSKKWIKDRLANPDDWDYSAKDLQLILKHFVKGSLKEEDKYLLLQFLRKFVKGDKEKGGNRFSDVFGYPVDAMLEPDGVLAALETYNMSEEDRRKYYVEKRKTRRKKIDANKKTEETEHATKKWAKGEKEHIKQSGKNLLGRMVQRIILPFKRLAHKREVTHKDAGKRPMNEFQDLKFYKDELVTELKEMKAAHGKNQQNILDGKLTIYNKQIETAPGGFNPYGIFKPRFEQLEEGVRSKTGGKELNLTTLLTPSNDDIAGFTLQNKLNQYNSKTTHDPNELPDLQLAAYNYYMEHVSNQESAKMTGQLQKLTQAEFIAKYDAAGIQSLINHTSNPTSLFENKLKTPADAKKEIFKLLQEIGQPLALNLIHANQRLSFLQDVTGQNAGKKIWESDLGKFYIIGTGAVLVAHDLNESISFNKFNIGQALGILSNFDLKGKWLSRDWSYPVGNKKINETKTLGWDLNWNKEMPGMGAFTKKYPGITFKDMKESTTGIPAGINFSRTYTESLKEKENEDIKEKDKEDLKSKGKDYLREKENKAWNFNGSFRIHVIPESHAPKVPDEQSWIAYASYLYAKKGDFDLMSLLKPNPSTEKLFKTNEINPLLYSSPNQTMLNSWLKLSSSFKYKKFNISGTASAGANNMFAGKDDRQKNLDLSGSLSFDKVRLSKYASFSAGSSFSGSWTNLLSKPGAGAQNQPASSGSMTNTLDYQYKTIHMSFSRTDNLNLSDAYSKYRLQFEATLPKEVLRGFGTLKFNLLVERMSKDSYSDAFITFGGGLILIPGGGGSGKVKIFKNISDLFNGK
jgi:hypothetical protein